MKDIWILTSLRIPKVGRGTVRYVIDMVNQSHEVTSTENLLELFKLANKSNQRIKVPSLFQVEEAYLEAKKIITESAKNNIEILSYCNPKFPISLKSIPDAPVLIYTKGDTSSINNSRIVAIIGTRNPTEYGLKAGIKLSEIFTQNKFTVVSGLAIGCDTSGHRGCLNKKGQTVAIMAGGLDKIYPKENSELAKEILDNKGCLISEYPIGERPRSSNFVERDRLQSAFSQAVIIIETNTTGGTMHTAGFAIKQKKHLACLDHPAKLLNHPNVQGNRQLVRENNAYLLKDSSNVYKFIQLLISNEKSSKKKQRKKQDLFQRNTIYWQTEFDFKWE